MPVTWNLRPLMAKRGIANANQLAQRANLTLPVAYRLLDGRDIERIETATLDRLATFFHVSPWRLLKHRDR